MKNLDRKSIFVGLLIPITAILFMGAVKNVLSRYHTIQAEEFQLVDGNGNAIFNLSDMLSADNSSQEEAVDYGPMISNLNSEINQLENSLGRLSRMVSSNDSKESNDNFVSLDVFTKNIQSMNKKVDNLSMKCDAEFKNMTSLKKSCDSDPSKGCCKNKQSQAQTEAQASNNDQLSSEVAALRSECEMLASAFDSYTSTDSNSSNNMSQELLDIRFELQRISDNQDMLMTILRKDIKKLKKK